jgi:hypothetical protein
MLENFNLYTIESCKELCYNATFNVRIDFMILIVLGFVIMLYNSWASEHYIFQDNHYIKESRIWRDGPTGRCQSKSDTI